MCWKRLAHQLYLQGYITYNQTESYEYSKEFIHQVQLYFIHQDKEKYIGDLNKITKIENSLSNEAIRVTNIHLSTIKVNDINLKQLYKLIYKNSIESCMIHSTYNSYNMTITAPCNHNYIHKLHIPIFLGWESNQSNENIGKKNTDILQYCCSSNVFIKNCVMDITKKKN